MLGFVQHVCRVQQCLGRDAANVQACAAKCLAPFNNGSFQTELGATNSADIAARAGTDNDDVVCGHEVSPWAKFGTLGRMICVCDAYGTRMARFR